MINLIYVCQTKTFNGISDSIRPGSQASVSKNVRKFGGFPPMYFLISEILADDFELGP